VTVTTKIVEVLERKLGLFRARAYKRCFQDETGEHISLDGQRVLADLRRFARIGQASFPVAVDGNMRMDPIKLARMEGRREVVWRMLEHINLDEAAIQTFMEVTVDE
jgi:hypothetical protein